jgi:hypothetical protein
MLSMLFGVILCFYFLYFISSSNEIGALLWKCFAMLVLVYRSHRDCTVMFLYNRIFVCGTLCWKFATKHIVSLKRTESAYVSV